MPVGITPLGGGRVEISGRTSIKMSDYGIEPPVLVGILTTGDEVIVKFDWSVVSKTDPASTPAR